MKKLMWIACAAALALTAFTSASDASIEVTNTGAEELNIETQGRITFGSPFIRIVCNKTVRGHIETTAHGELALRANSAGILGDVRVSGCSGGSVVPLVNLTERAIRLSWLRAPIASEGSEIKLGGNNFLFLAEAAGERCLYQAEITISTPRAEVRGLYRESLELRLLETRSIRRISGGILCPSVGELTMSGNLLLTRPSVGIGVRLRGPEGALTARPNPVEIARAPATEEEVTLTNTDTEFRIDLVQFIGDASFEFSTEARCNERSALAPRASCRIRVRVKPEARRPARGTVSVRYLLGGRELVLNIAVSAA